MGGSWLNNPIDLEDVWQGPAAAIALLRAFMRASGTFDVLFSLGVQTHKPGEWIILIDIGGEKFAVPPAILRSFGRALLDSLQSAARMGAREEQIAPVRDFAEVMISNAEEALSLSPHGLH
jgi:hypothetical protein